MAEAALAPKEELQRILDTYRKSLLVFDSGLVAIKETTLSRLVRAVHDQNMYAINQLAKPPLEPIMNNLSSLWNIARMKAAYGPVCEAREKLTTLMGNIQRNRTYMDAVAAENKKLFGDDKLLYVSPVGFPGQFISHLCLLQSFLGSVEKGSYAYERLGTLIAWLNEEHRYLSSIKGFDAVKDNRIEDEIILEQIDGETEIKGKKTSVTIFLSATYLVFQISPSIPIIGKPEVFYDLIRQLTLDKSVGDRMYQLVLKGQMIFFAELEPISVSEEKQRDDFYLAFLELKIP